jgi:hypothetical protein
MDNASTRAQLLEHFLSFFMPEGILDFFELVWAESQSLDSRESKKDILYTGTLHMYLDERDNRTDQMQDLRIVSHGTLQVCHIISRIGTL